jgi:hypothetical protein
MSCCEVFKECVFVPRGMKACKKPTGDPDDYILVPDGYHPYKRPDGDPNDYILVPDGMILVSRSEEADQT